MTDLSEGTKLCNNCQQKINLANFLIHESFCLRNIQICDLCRKPVNKNQKDEHFEEFHKKVKCECGELVEKMHLEAHKEESCRKRQGNCFFCGLSLDFDKLEEHIEFCGSRTEKCEKCNQYIKAKDSNKHESTNCAYPPQPVQQASAMTRHQQNFGKTYFNDNLIQRSHSIETRPFKQDLNDDQVGIPCEFCSETYLSDELIEHQNSCPLNPILAEETHNPDPISTHLNGLWNRNFNIDSHMQLINGLNDPLSIHRENFLNNFRDPFGLTTGINNMDNITNMEYITDDEDEEFNNSYVPAVAVKKNTEDDNNKIPCELCDELVDFEDYGLHQATCRYAVDVLEASRPSLNPIISQYDVKNNIENKTNENETKRTESKAIASKSILKNSKSIPLAKEAAASVSSLKPAIKSSGLSNSSANSVLASDKKTSESFKPSTRYAGQIPFASNQTTSSNSTTNNPSTSSTSSKTSSLSKNNGFTKPK